MYVIQATVTKLEGEYHCNRQIPTFFLNENIQGIISEEGAEKIARDIINPTSDPSIEVYIGVAKIN